MRADEDELEGRLNDALATYAEPDATPTPGHMALRAIAAAQERQSAFRWWTCAALVSALTCLLLLVLVARAHRQVAPFAIGSTAAQPKAALKSPTPPPAALSAGLRTVSARKSKQPLVEAKAPALPRLDRFPTPAPLTEEEKLMLAFVATASAATQQFVARAVEPPLPNRIAEEQPLSGGEGAVETSKPTTLKAGASHEEHP